AVIFGAIDVVVRSAVDDCLILTPRSRRGNVAGGDIEFLAREEFDMRSILIDLAQCFPELAIGAGDEDLPRGHWGDIVKLRVVTIFVRNLRWRQRPWDHV